MAKRNDGRTKLGRFAPGKSGNPTGGRKAVPHADDWQNFFTGLGVFGKDKRIGTEFNLHTLSFDALKDLWLGDDLAARAVETIPKEALRQGYDISIASGQDDADAASMDPAELASEVSSKLETLGVDQYLEECGAYERGYGGSALLIGVNDGQEDMTQPLNLNRVRSVDWLTPLEAREMMPLYAYGDPRAPKYGQPEIYQLSSRSVLPSYGGNYASTSMQIHESRLIVFPGIRVSRYQTTTARGGWGESVLSRVYRVLRDFNTAWSSAGVLVSDFAQSVIKIAGLWEALALDGAKAFQNRLAAMEYGRNVTNSVTIDAGDSYERQQTPLSGLPDLLDKFAVRLAAACDMPLTLLFGTSPAGMNATGESDIRFFYDRVAAYQQRKMEPALRRLVQILFRTVGNKREPDKWSIKFRPLWQDSAKDKAAAMLTQAQADVAWIGAGVLSPEEVANAHWGKGEYDPNLTVDFEAREAGDMAAPEPVSPEPEPGDPDYIPPPGPGTAKPNGEVPPPGAPAAPDPNTPPQLTGQQSEDHADERDERARFAGRGFGMPSPGQSSARASHERMAGEYADKVAVSADKARIRSMHASAHAAQGDFDDYAAAQRDAITHQNRAAQAMSKVIYHATRAGTDVARGHAERAAEVMAGPRVAAFKEPEQAPERTDEWSDAAREAALAARRENANGHEPMNRQEASARLGKEGDPKISLKEASRRAEMASKSADTNSNKSRGSARAIAHARASELNTIAAQRQSAEGNHEKAAEHTAAAERHANAAEKLSNPNGRASVANANQYAEKGAKADPAKVTRTTEKRGEGEIIHAEHGFSDKSGRAIGGQAHIEKNSEGYSVRVNPTRNGKEFGAYGHASTQHATLEEARAHANEALNKQSGNILKKSEEVQSREKGPAQEARERGAHLGRTGSKPEGGEKAKGEGGKGKKEPKEHEGPHLLGKFAEVAKAAGGVVGGEGTAKEASALNVGGEGGEGEE